ncbi:hypothetical protein ACFQY7_49910 [Actinomadura luteofluorescens]
MPTSTAMITPVPTSSSEAGKAVEMSPSTSWRVCRLIPQSPWTSEER